MAGAHRSLWAMGLLLACLSTPAQPADRDRIGLVLAGGGARGLAHVGVIRALEELRVPVDAITGTSMGALVGGLYASGMSGAELQETVAGMDWGQAFRDAPRRPRIPLARKSDDYDFPGRIRLEVKDDKLSPPLGLLEGQQSRQLIKHLLAGAESVEHFDQLPRPFRAVATDIASGQPVVLEQGDLAAAMRASMSIPGLLAPVEIDGRTLVDGGAAMNIPISPARQMQLDHLIVVDIGAHLKSHGEIDSLVSIADQMIKLMSRRNSLEQLSLMNETDLLIAPDVGRIGLIDFQDWETIVASGYQATMAMAPALRSLALEESAWAAYRSSITQLPGDSTTIDFIEIRDDSPLDEAIVRSGISQPTAAALDTPQLEADLATVYALGHWQSIDYQLARDERGTGLVIETRYDQAGRNSLKLGLSILTEINEQADFSANASFLSKGLNALGGEFSADLRLGNEMSASLAMYQPLNTGARFYLQPFLGYREQKVDSLGVEFDLEETVGRWRVRDTHAELAAGLNLGNSASWDVALFRAQGKYDLDRAATAQLEEANYDEGGWSTRFRYDTLDDLYFPSSGLFVHADYQSHRTGLGADYDFERARLVGQAAFSFGEQQRNSLILTSKLMVHEDAELQPQNLYQLGGLFNFSALPRNSLSGRQMAFLMAQYQRRLTTPGVLPFAVPLYVGASLEGAQLWSDASDISLHELETAGSIYLGANTPLGPAFLAYGRTSGGVDAWYLSVAWPFLLEGLLPLR